MSVWRALAALPLAAMLATISTPGLAQVSAPLYVKNLSPVAGLLGLPSQRAAGSQRQTSWIPQTNRRSKTAHPQCRNASKYRQAHARCDLSLREYH